MDESVIKVLNLKKYYSEGKNLAFLPWVSPGSYLKAVDNINLSIRKNEVLGLVGESGCGKSTLGKTILRLEEPTAGKIFFKDQDITYISQEELKILRRKIQIIFQDPASSLNPRKTVFQTISQPLKIHKLVSTKSEMIDRVENLLEKVGMEKNHMERYPHQFSGGQKQRICIARAISMIPSFLVADEVVSALDVSVQAQILNLLNVLKNDLELSILFISHDLSVVRQISDRVAVMYLGKIVELAPSENLFTSPMHPYTQALISAIPIPEADTKWTPILLKGEAPSPYQELMGCSFQTRCSNVFDRCKTEEVRLKQVKDGHFVRCHLYNGQISST